MDLDTSLIQPITLSKNSPRHICFVDANDEFHTFPYISLLRSASFRRTDLGPDFADISLDFADASVKILVSPFLDFLTALQEEQILRVRKGLSAKRFGTAPTYGQADGCEIRNIEIEIRKPDDEQEDTSNDFFSEEQNEN